MALFGHAAISELSLLSGVKRKLDFEPAKGSFCIRVSDDGRSGRCGLHRGRRPKASNEGTRVRLGETAAAGYGDLIARMWVCGSRLGAGMTLLRRLVWLIGFD